MRAALWRLLRCAEPTVTPTTGTPLYAPVTAQDWSGARLAADADRQDRDDAEQAAASAWYATRVRVGGAR